MSRGADPCAVASNTRPLGVQETPFRRRSRSLSRDELLRPRRAKLKALHLLPSFAPPEGSSRFSRASHAEVFLRFYFLHVAARRPRARHSDIPVGRDAAELQPQLPGTKIVVKKHSNGTTDSQVTTLYLLVLDKRLNRPGTEQNTSAGEPTILRPLWSFLISGKNGGESAK